MRIVKNSQSCIYGTWHSKIQALRAARVFTSLDISRVVQIVGLLPSSPKCQWKMFHKVISSFRLEADSLPGLLPITKVNKKCCRKLLAIKYMLTLAHVCALGIGSKTFQPLFISSVVLKKTRQDSASTAKRQPLRACVAVALCISSQWLYWKTKTKTELRRAYG